MVFKRTLSTSRQRRPFIGQLRAQPARVPSPGEIGRPVSVSLPAATTQTRILRLRQADIQADLCAGRRFPRLSPSILFDISTNVAYADSESWIRRRCYTAVRAGQSWLLRGRRFRSGGFVVGDR